MSPAGGPSIWELLGIAQTQDVTAIRRAYAHGLRRTHPEDDPQGFALLRAAYEAALRLAHSRVTASSVMAAAMPDSPAVSESPGAMSGNPATIPESPAAIPESRPVSPEIATLRDQAGQLRADCFALQALLAGEAPLDEQLARDRLMACLASPALEHVGVQLPTERWFATVLWQYRERAESLFEPVIEHFHWRAPGRASGRAHTLAPLPALLEYAQRVRQLRDLQVRSPRAHAALTRTPQAARLWLRIVLLRLDEKVRPAWTALTAPLAGVTLPIPRAADARALAWWQRYFTGAHLQPRFIRLAGLLALLGALEGALHPVGPPAALTGGGNGLLDVVLGALAGAALGLMLALLQFACIEWPRRRWPLTAPTRWRRLGWFPAGLGLCLIAATLPAGLTSTAVIALAGAGLGGWAIVADATLRRDSSPPTLRRSLGFVTMNVPLIVWGVWMRARQPDLLTAPLLVASAAWVLASTLARGQLWAEVRYTLSQRLRQRARWLLAVLAALSLAGLLQLQGPVPTVVGRAVLVGLLGIVLSQRVGALGLTAELLKWRYYLTVLPALLFFPTLWVLDDPLRLGGEMLMGGVLLTLALWDWNERRAAPASSRVAVAKGRL